MDQGGGLEALAALGAHRGHATLDLRGADRVRVAQGPPAKRREAGAEHHRQVEHARVGDDLLLQAACRLVDDR